MKTGTHFTFALLMLGIASCNANKSVDPEFKYDRISTSQKTDTGAVQATNAAPIINQNNTPVISAPSGLGSNSTGKNLNPAHGQPGHRCEIAVGAPLNSKPVAAANQQQKIAPSTPILPKPGIANKNLNPAHGQPGHRCEIAVGAPL